jgi:CDP-glucose 4,6-dehydratase
VEGVVLTGSRLASFYDGRKVLLTGHTGFKGSWMASWLKMLGARLAGYSLLAEPGSLFEEARVASGMTSIAGDIRDYSTLAAACAQHEPEVIFHFAAQPFVRRAYRSPAETYATNVMGTVHVLEAARHTPSVRVIVVITTDKCYDNREWVWGYREADTLGGRDPYSSSKACAELATGAYRQSYAQGANGAAIATARAGNVIGGGDWGEERLVPDIFRALRDGNPIILRNPTAIRPWQHVLEPLRGYLMLGERLGAAKADFADAWNFGPRTEDIVPVRELAERVVGLWGSGELQVSSHAGSYHEANILRLDWSKADSLLGWRPLLGLPETIRMTVEGYRVCLQSPSNAAAMMTQQISAYMTLDPA